MTLRTSISALLLITTVTFIYSCGGDNTTTNNETTTVTQEETNTANPETYDPNRGEGKFTAENVVVNSTIDEKMASTGEAIAGTKCVSCHKLTDEKLVGPGWKGVTERRKPEWIMNFITNPDPMINKDPAVQSLLELCLVRMPNQGLSDDDARNILEFMRKNDASK